MIVRNDYLKFVTLIADCSHVGKNCQSKFSNWFLALNNERENLS